MAWPARALLRTSERLLQPGLYLAGTEERGRSSIGHRGRCFASGMSIKREYPESPLVGVGAIIIEGDHVALVKRGRPPLQGKWSIPGGVLEVGETLRKAAIREARSE